MPPANEGHIGAIKPKGTNPVGNLQVPHPKSPLGPKGLDLVTLGASPLLPCSEGFTKGWEREGQTI